MARLASLPMYALDGLGEAHGALWAAIAARLESAGIDDVPKALETRGSAEEHWAHPELLFSQACGYPFMTAFRTRLRLVATPHYTAPGCVGPSYTSAVLVGAENPASSLSDMRGGVCALNDRGSHSGMNALRALIAPLAQGPSFFRDVIVTGSHAASIERVAAGDADVCAVDAVTYALLHRHRPSALVATRVLMMTAPAPALPYVTRSDLPDAAVAALRLALVDVMRDPMLAEARRELLLEGVTILEADAYAPIRRAEEAARALGYPELA